MTVTRPRPTWIAAALAGLSLAALIACGGTRAKSAAPPTSTAEAMPGGAPATPGASPKDEIAELEATIKADLQQMGVQPPVIVPGTPDDPRPMAAIQGVCRPPAQQPTLCRDVCGLSDRICSAAGRICELSAQLAGDADAASKCQSGKKSCETAQQRCCDCK